jgi:hypothetical protein
MLIIYFKKLPCCNQLLDQLLVNSIKTNIQMATNCWITSVKQINQNKHPHGNELLDHLLVKSIIKKHPHGNELLDHVLVKSVKKDCHVAPYYKVIGQSILS